MHYPPEEETKQILVTKHRMVLGRSYLAVALILLKKLSTLSNIETAETKTINNIETEAVSVWLKKLFSNLIGRVKL